MSGNIEVGMRKWFETNEFYYGVKIEDALDVLISRAINYDDPWLVFFLASGVAGISWATMHTYLRFQRPTTIECKAKINAANNLANQWPVGMEPHMGGADTMGNEGQAYFVHDNAGASAKYKVCTRKAVAYECSELSAQDWTVERTFKIEWTATYVKYYVDGALKETHTTYEPDCWMLIFHELHVKSTDTLAADAAMYIRFGSLKVL